MENNNYCTYCSSKEHHFTIPMRSSEDLRCHFLLGRFEESSVLIQPNWQHWRPQSSLSSQKQVIVLQALITLTAMLIFYPGLYATFMSREDFLPLHQAVSLLQIKSLSQTVFLKYPGDGDWDSSNLLHRSNQRDILS